MKSVSTPALWRRLLWVSSVMGAAWGGVGMAGAADAASPADRVAAHLSAGEFGQALDIAQSVEDFDARTQMLRRIVAAQTQAGDFAGARRTTRGIADPQQRGAERNGIARQQALAGGFGADFDAIIDLIQNQTSGPWEEIDGIGGTIEEFESGVRVDPRGMLVRVSEEDVTGRLSEIGVRARGADLNNDMARASTLRMVSLTRLEQAVSERLAKGEPVLESMQQLAGLSQIQYVFLYPETREIVIAGPAEGWSYDSLGRPVGTESHLPTLQLDDLVTVLRTFDAGQRNMFGCSIDPQPERLKDLKEFAARSQAKGPLAPGQTSRWAKQLGETLGAQDVSIYGVPANSRVARVIVEADYRMKLIGIGKLDGGPHVPDYFELLAKNPGSASGSLDALRWWLTMHYDAVQHSPDRAAFEVRGSSVLCRSENQFVTEQGGRVQTGKAEPINREFAANFSEHYSDLAQREPVFADLQGVFDLALVAALIEHEDLDARAEWDRGVFATNGAYRPAEYAVPMQAETVVNHKVFNGRDVVVQVAGGVRADLVGVVSDPKLATESPRVAGVAAASQANELPAGRWWWDAK